MYLGMMFAIWSDISCIWCKVKLLNCNDTKKFMYQIRHNLKHCRSYIMSTCDLHGLYYVNSWATYYVNSRQIWGVTCNVYEAYLRRVTRQIWGLFEECHVTWSNVKTGNIHAAYLRRNTGQIWGIYVTNRNMSRSASVICFDTQKSDMCQM